MNELHAAYAALGLEPGASVESVLLRYRRLAFAWHPDRAATRENRRLSEEKLKKINNAKDLLIRHFQTEHKQADCRCQPQRTSTSIGTKTGRSPDLPTKKWALIGDKYKVDWSKLAALLVIPVKWVERCPFSWRLVAALVVCFLACNALVSSGRRMASPLQEGSGPCVASPLHSESSRGSERNSNVPKEQLEPIQDRQQSVGERVHSEIQLQIEQRRQKQHDEDIYFTRLDIDTAKRTIDRCTSDLAQLEVKALDNGIADCEKQKLGRMIELRQRNLMEARQNLESAQRALHILESVQPEIPAYGSTRQSIVGSGSTEFHS